MTVRMVKANGPHGGCNKSEINARFSIMEPYLVIAGFVAGAANAIAGGGPLLTLAALTAAGFDPRIANLTSTVALCPGQLAAGWQSRRGLKALAVSGQVHILALLLALVFGAVGAGLLIATDAAKFAAIVPWFILLATGLYAWSGRGRDALRKQHIGRAPFLAVLGFSATYGGYFGGGNSFVVLALLALAGVPGHAGAEAKNALIAAINLGAVAIFAVSGEVDWGAALAVGLGGVIGSLIGVRLLKIIRPALLRPLIITVGLGLAGWFFVT